MASDLFYCCFSECSVKKCSMIFSFETDDPTRFRFEKDGRITHIQSSKCLALITDTFGDYDELVLLHDCNHPASRWTMHNYPEKGQKSIFVVT